MENTLSAVNSEVARTPEMIAAEIRAMTGQVLSAFLEIGRRFVEAKEMLAHGEFGAWVRDRTGYSVSTANNCMRLYKEYGQDQGSLFGTEAKSQTIGNLGYAKALALLEVPAEEREKFAEDVGAEGLSVRELRAAIKDREDRATEAEARAVEAENVAEGYRLKLESEKLEKESLLAQKDGEVERANAELEALRRELREMQEAPKEVAVETVVDEEAVKKAAEEARAEAEKGLRAKIEKAERERDKAVKARSDAEQALASVKLEKDSAEETAKKAQEISDAQLADLRKKLALAESPEKVSFKFWFDQGQACVNNMLECVGKLRSAGKNEDADKLANALRVFLEQALLYSGKVGE